MRHTHRRRFHFRVTGGLLLFLLFVSGPSGIRAEGPGSEDASFRRTVNEFIESELWMFPERATGLGDHRFDSRIDEVSDA